MSWKKKRELLIHVFCKYYDDAEDKDKVDTTNKDDPQFNFIQ